MIERLPAPDSILELAMRRCVFVQDTLRIFLIEANQTDYPLLWSSLTKDWQTEPIKGGHR